MDINTLFRDFGELISQNTENIDSVGSVSDESTIAKLWPFIPQESYYEKKLMYYLMVENTGQEKPKYKITATPVNSSLNKRQIAEGWYFATRKGNAPPTSATGFFKNFKPEKSSGQHLLGKLADKLPLGHPYKEILLDIGKTFRENNIINSGPEVSDDDIVTITIVQNGENSFVMEDPDCQDVLLNDLYRTAENWGTCPICGKENKELVQSGSTAWKLFSTTRKTNAHSFYRCLSCERKINYAEKFLEEHILAHYQSNKAKSACIFIPASTRGSKYTDIWFDKGKTKNLSSTLEMLIEIATDFEAVYALNIVFVPSNNGINLVDTRIELLTSSTLQKIKYSLEQTRKIVRQPEEVYQNFNFWQVPGLTPLIFRLMLGKADFPMRRLSSILRATEKRWRSPGSLVWLEVFYLAIQKGEDLMLKDTPEYGCGQIFRMALNLEYRATKRSDSRLKAKYRNPRPHQLGEIARESLQAINRYGNRMTKDERLELSAILETWKEQETDFLETIQHSKLPDNQRMIAFLVGTQTLWESEKRRFEQNKQQNTESIEDSLYVEL